MFVEIQIILLETIEHFGDFRDFFLEIIDIIKEETFSSLF